MFVSLEIIVISYFLCHWIHSITGSFVFHHFQGDTSYDFHAHRFLFEKGSTLEGNNLLPLG